MTNHSAVRLVALSNEPAYNIALAARTRIKSKHKGAACVVYAARDAVYVRDVNNVFAKQLLEHGQSAVIGVYDGTATIEDIHADVSDWLGEAA